MKKLPVALVLALSMLLFAAVPAQAELRMSVKTQTHTAGHTVFKARASRPSRVRITVYKDYKVVRRLKARKTGRVYQATWNQRDAHDRRLAAGSYSYKVVAATKSAKKTVRGKVRVSPRPTTTPKPTTPPITVTPTPTVTPVPTAPPAPTVPPAAGRWFGFYVDGNLETMAPLLAVEAAIGRHAKVAHLFMDDSERFPAARVNAITQHGSIPLVTLQFQSLWSGGGLDAINDGSHDAYIIAFADAAKANGNIVWFRPFHEMNGDWTAWSPGRGTNTPAKLIAAWRRVHGIFVARGATNVKFVWCPNDYGATPIEQCFPGDAYFDYAAIDTYNFGTLQAGSWWTSFGSKFTTPYNKILSLTSKPLFIAEISCVEPGGNKAAWVADMFEQLRTRYPRVEGVVWFNDSHVIDFRAESSAASLNAFKTELARGF